MRAGQRGGEPEAAGLDRLVQQRDHLVELLGRGLVADRCGAHHLPAQRAVTDHEGGVHAERAVEAVEVVAEATPTSQSTPVLEREQRHALDLGHHPAQVVGVTGGEGREGEPAVAADDVVMPWRFDGDAAGSQKSCAS